MRVGSLFSGIGGFDLGLECAGMKVVFQSEIDPYCNQVLKKHYPEVTNLGDITKIGTKGDDVNCRQASVDIICGGFPCQDLSVAGNRKGLAGERSGLFFEFMRIADSQPEALLLIENVPGLLSSKKGEDFGIVLREITGYHPAVPRRGWRNSGICVGPKRACIWRVLNSQYFGVAQRRRRVFIIAGPGDGSDLLEILFESESLSGDFKKGQKTGPKSGTLAASGAGTNRPAGQGNELDFIISYPLKSGGNLQHDESHEPYVVSTLNSGGNNGGFRTEPGEHLVVSHALSSPHSGQRLDPNGETFIPYPTLRSNPRNNSCPSTEISMLIWAENDRNEIRTTYPFPALSASGGGRPGHSFPVVGVRRLTPLECERLQGFPETWTRYGIEINQVSDSARYRMLGNAVTVNVIYWIGKRIIKYYKRGSLDGGDSNLY